jgi:hypothetical protein
MFLMPSSVDFKVKVDVRAVCAVQCFGLTAESLNDLPYPQLREKLREVGLYIYTFCVFPPTSHTPIKILYWFVCNNNMQNVNTYTVLETNLRRPDQ